jgi:prophage regulatory protein
MDIGTATPRLLRLPAVMERTGLSRSAIYRAIKSQSFPAPVKVGRRSVAWSSAAIEQWVLAALAGKGGGGHD